VKFRSSQLPCEQRSWRALVQAIQTIGLVQVLILAELATLAPRARAEASDQPRPVVVGEAQTGASLPGVDWVRAGLNTNQPVWGIRGALLWGLPPKTGRPPDGPRGLIRLRYPVLTNGGYDLLNFIAIEPIVQGRRGLSELEASQLDGVAGKRLWPSEPAGATGPGGHLPAGHLTRLENGAERLTLEVAVERFSNGAHVRLILSQSSAAPDELDLTVQPEPDSAPLDYCILSATMGNKARARLLWLETTTVSSLDLYSDYRASGFTAHRVFALDRLQRTSAGDVVAAITTNEPDPAAVDPKPAASHWRYRGLPVTQFWRKPAGTWREDLGVAVNGRYTYWMSEHPIPGGVAFENFEMRERFYPGQRFVFGITRRTPLELGLTRAAAVP
jgi:hypothetical protein